MPLLDNSTISVASRASPLALVQVAEVLNALKEFYPHICFEVTSTMTGGDLDRVTSLTTLGFSDFFTKEVDELLLKNQCDIAIHSAKDLPDPIHPDLKIVALTEGVDPRDTIVMKKGFTVETLPFGAKIATSSLRRMEMIKALRSDFTLVDIRGTIDERLEKLSSSLIDGVVMARAALIRLGLTELNQHILEVPAAPLQGRLAIIARKTDAEMAALFSCLNSN